MVSEMTSIGTTVVAGGDVDDVDVMAIKVVRGDERRIGNLAVARKSWCASSIEVLALKRSGRRLGRGSTKICFAWSDDSSLGRIF